MIRGLPQDSGQVCKKHSVLNFNTAFHSQTDGQSGRTIQMLDNMLRASDLDFSGN